MTSRTILRMRFLRLLSVVLFLVPLAIQADEPTSAETWRRDHAQRFSDSKHYLLESRHLLREEEKSDLAARGVEIQQALPGNRYVVRVASDATLDATTDARVARLDAFTPQMKMARAAYREVAQAKAFARLRIVFHDDVNFAAARQSVEDLGGMIEGPLTNDFSVLHSVRVRLPFGAAMDLAGDERVRAIYGPPLRPVADNSNSAIISNVPPLFSAPYNLSGAGVTLSLFEIGKTDATHREFGGRVTNVGTAPAPNAGNDRHATHVAGTMASQGIDPHSKGMSPAATVKQYYVDDNFLDTKNSQLASIGSQGDNNSWGYILGWCDSSRCDAPTGWVWTGNEDAFGGYDLTDASLDHIARDKNVLMIHSAGNDGGTFGPAQAPFAHNHQDNNGNTISGEIFCYSSNGSGTDCPAPPICTSGTAHCEVVRHPPNGPVGSMGLLSSSKNIISVGAVDIAKSIAGFSSQGPTRDGRVKPDVVARGVNVYSTFPNNLYGTEQGTSMASPVVTGVAGLLTEQWRKTFGGANPSPNAMKTVIIAGADDLGRPGPDYVYGFGLTDAKNSADIIIADGGTGKRIAQDPVGQSASVLYRVTTTAATPNLRFVLGWIDPEVLGLGSNDLAGKTLVNDLDLTVIDPSGNTVLPYVLDGNNPGNNATRGRNSVDNVEEVEIANAPAGIYTVTVKGTAITQGTTQNYALVVNSGSIGEATVPCSDSYEPNETSATAFGPLASGQQINAKVCSTSDADFYSLRIDRSGPLVVNVLTTDTPLKVTISGDGIGTPIVTSIPAGSLSSFVTVQIGSGTKQLLSPARNIFVEVQADGTVGATGSYSITPAYTLVAIPHQRIVRH